MHPFEGKMDLINKLSSPLSTGSVDKDLAPISPIFTMSAGLETTLDLTRPEVF